MGWLFGPKPGDIIIYHDADDESKGSGNTVYAVDADGNCFVDHGDEESEWVAPEQIESINCDLPWWKRIF